MQVAECTVRGYLTVELDLIVLVTPVTQHASELQLEACSREAEKLASLIRRSSPRVLSELSLSALTAATVIHTVVNSAGILHITLPYYIVPALFLLLRWSRFPT